MLGVRAVIVGLLAGVPRPYATAPPPRTIIGPWYSPTVGSWEGGVSHERDTHVDRLFSALVHTSVLTRWKTQCRRGRHSVLPALGNQDSGLRVEGLRIQGEGLRIEG